MEIGDLHETVAIEGFGQVGERQLDTLDLKLPRTDEAAVSVDNREKEAGDDEDFRGTRYEVRGAFRGTRYEGQV